LTAAVPRIGAANSGAPAFPAIGKSLMTKILLIEDDGETAEEVAAERAERGFEVEWSADGTAGLASARSSRPDVMIVDRMLPGMDDLSIIETLRQEQVSTRCWF
jgi:two-component system OmpR family response regulator